MARKPTWRDYREDDFGRVWLRGKDGDRWEAFRINLEWRTRKHAPRVVRHVIYEGDVVLAELDHSDTAHRFVHELLQEREGRDLWRIWWRVTFNLMKGRGVILWREEIFLQGETLTEAAKRAIQLLEDEYSGLVEIVAMRQANHTEVQVLDRPPLRPHQPFRKAREIKPKRQPKDPSLGAAGRRTGLEQQPEHRDEKNHQRDNIADRLVGGA